MSKMYQEAEKFINENFHKGSYDGRSKFDVAKIVGDSLIAKVDAEDPYHDPVPGIVHASQLYGCLRGVFYEMMGIKEDVQEEYNKRRMAGVFEAGHLFEDFIVKSLGDRVLETQRDYKMQYKSLTLVGHSDYRIDDDGIMRIGENKSVHSDAFHYRKQEGTLVAWQNQIQLQIYLWLERKLFGNEWEGIFSYISKDDCTIDYAPVKFNPAIIDEIVIPILDLLNAAYERACALPPMNEVERTVAIVGIGKEMLPAPDMALFSSARGSYGVNWLAKYCKFHNTCAGNGWLLEAQAEVKRKNTEHKESIVRSVGGETKPVKTPVGIKAE